jgi:uncharacterized protein YbgA (DUF1722 family)
MDIDIIINNLKEMLVDRGDNIDEFNEHEIDIDREDFYNDKNIIEFHTSSTTIIFALTRKLRRSILEELKDLASVDIANFTNKYNDKLNVIIVFNNDTISTPILVQLTKYDKMLQKKGGTLQYFHLKNHQYCLNIMSLSQHTLLHKYIKRNNAINLL